MTSFYQRKDKKHYPLYDPRFEHDACGVGFVASIEGRQSHAILEKGIQSVVNVTHRGAIAADAKTGDGAGVLVQIGRKFFEREAKKLGVSLKNFGDLAVGMIFLPGSDKKQADRARCLVEDEVKKAGIVFFGWRRVPVDPTVLGDEAGRTRPDIEQIFMGRPEKLSVAEYEKELYRVRRQIENRAQKEKQEGFHIPSFSSKTICYKGLFVATQLKTFYKDLSDTSFETAVTLFHQRYSTNTFPDWVRAQPFRMLAHNGEINTLQGNQNWLRAREPELYSPVWKKGLAGLMPVIQPAGSDSQNLDNCLEFLVRSGRDILHSQLMLVPEAWENMPHMDPVLRSFYEYHACLSEPWDGPAALGFTDGDWVGAILDRNGLRPARYQVTDDGVIIMGSEVGMVPTPDAHIVEKGRIGPGEMIAVDLVHGKLLHNQEIKDALKNRQPYGDWVQKHIVKLSGLKAVSRSNGEVQEGGLSLMQRQQAFGFSPEDLKEIIRAMVVTKKEPVFSMGDDTPLSVLSDKPRLLYTYFKQRFAQVTNPPIDPEREELVMSVNMYLGPRRSFLEETPGHARLIELETPVLSDEDFDKIKSLEDPLFRSCTLPALFDVSRGREGLDNAVGKLCQAAEKCVDDGCSIVILSDKGISKSAAPIPMLLAVGAVHHALIRSGKRMRCSIVVESGEPRDVHHFASLIGYGASAVYPYLIYESTLTLMTRGEIKDCKTDEALEYFRQAVRKGLLKIMSKMGISTLSGYHGAQIFEAIGLDKKMIERYFTGTSSQVGGVDLSDLAQDVLHWHQAAMGEPKALETQGHVRFRRGGEYHAFNPEVLQALNAAIEKNDTASYNKYAALVNERPPTALRDLIAFKKGKSIPIDEVQSVEEICKQFCVSGMSHGALSKEAHEQLGIAMNRLGAKSSSGEGGEDPSRFKPWKNGDWANSQIKQVASGRFGVTAHYLINATGIEIKVAQGSKPGEGGQLPGKKVTEEIARNRHTVPGVTLISPPPHHDIYSIEDLAQLIYDLKQSNPKALITVKLVAEAGVGTIAAGVAKGYADVIMISGHDGGTGASSYSSIKHAGSAWELGLAETQQVLVLNGLRDRVTLRTDGGLKTGRDVVVAAILGAEEFGFGTAAVITTGCVMARQCHLNTCPVGVATQKPELRAKFKGKAEYTVNFFKFVAAEARQLMADLGIRRLQDLCGRTDLLERKRVSANPKLNKVDLSCMLAASDLKKPQHRVAARNDRIGDEPLDKKMIRDAQSAIDGQDTIALSYQVHNTHRALGTQLSSEIARRYGSKGLADGTIQINFSGSAGQSLGAFLMKGARICLEGEANDYVGKGMSGGQIIVRPSRDARFKTHENSIIGNTVLYGATSGMLYAAGRAGERFCVRASGANAVVEGVGDHGCEYMTGGTVIVLGQIGRNFGAGMTGGLAYILDEEKIFEERINPQFVVLERLSDSGDIDTVRKYVQQHWEFTESPRARDILDRWPHYEPLFWKVVPKETIARRAQAAPVPIGG